MDYISNQEQQIRQMLDLLNLSSIEELFDTIPKDLFLPKPKFDDGLCEYEGRLLMEGIAQKNQFVNFESYLGAGAYEHHVPAIVQAICSRSEFLTSYTPYQAEASQGMLQAIFEYQSVICALTDMDVANASVYDGASACAEAIGMALRAGEERRTILVADSLHPHYRAVIEQYTRGKEVCIHQIPLTSFQEFLNADVAAVVVSYPNFFGAIDDLTEIVNQTHSHGALAIVSANPLVYGLYASAGEMGFDIAVGDCQPLGLPLNFGGPYVGYMACKQQLVRQLPGRIVGETLDTQGRRGFVLTLQAREQHIRREKANSNICTNQALASLAVLITTLWYGKHGVAELALTNFQRTTYLKEHLLQLGFTSPDQGPIFNEFVIDFHAPAPIVQAHFRKEGIEPGLDLGPFYPSFKDSFLIAVTETKNKQQLDRFIDIAKRLK